MAYIGTDVNYGNIASQTGVGNGSTTPIATLDYTVPTSASIIVTLDGVTQVPTTDYVATGTTLTFTSSVASPIAILVVFLGRSLDIGTPADNTVTNAKMANNAIDSAELAAGSVDLAHLSATGTPTASLALKGDFSWGTAGGTSLAGGMIRTNLLAISSPVTFAGTENGVTYGPISVTALVTVTSPSVWHIL
jgi:hypothetical protein|tara:strand:+ start:1216 stop:1791 length:576 start_codon:yes stop_codon:yes gene_type:complete